MALSITKLKSGINTKGGGVIRVVERNEDGTVIAGAPVIDLGYLKDVTLSDKTPSENLKDETGLTITQELGDREVMVSGTFMQSNKEILDIAEECRGKYYSLYRLNSRPGSTTAQEIFYAVGTITPQFEIKFPGGELPFEYKASAVQSAVSISGTALTSSPSAGFGAYTSTTVTIPANRFYKVVETAASVA